MPILLTSPIFRLNDLRHLFGGLFAARYHPHTDDGVESGAEKFDVVGDVGAVKILLGAVRIVDHHLMLCVIAQLKVGPVKQLILFDVGEHLQRAAGNFLLRRMGELPGKILFQLLAHLVRQIVDVDIVGIKGGEVVKMEFPKERVPRLLDIEKDDLCRTARDMGVSFGQD